MKRNSRDDLLFPHRPFPRRSKYLPGLLAVSVLATSTVYAGDTYQSGHISRVSYATNGVLIMLDTGPPTNCAATPYGWMMIAAPYTAIISFVTGLWFRGDAAANQLTIYTTGIDSTGYCQINQIDTMSAGGN